MDRRNMLKGGLVGLLGLGLPTQAETKDIEEERTRQYLDNISLWNEHVVLHNKKDAQHREFLFTGGVDRKELLDTLENELDGYALVYSPRWIIQRGHFFDMIWVKIGDKNVTAITGSYKRHP